MTNNGTCGTVKVQQLTEVETIVQDFDILLCVGNSSMSKRIQWYQRMFCDVTDEAAQISHVAMIARNWMPGAVGMERSGYGEVFESTTLNKWADKKGSQTNPLWTWLQHYKGDVYLLPLQFARVRVHFNKLDRLIAEAKGQPYEDGIPGLIELLLCGMPWIKNTPTDSPHCSEQNVRALQAAGLFDADQLPNKFPPCEFWPGGRFYEYVADEVEVLDPVKIVR